MQKRMDDYTCAMKRSTKNDFKSLTDYLSEHVIFAENLEKSAFSSKFTLTNIGKNAIYINRRL